MKPWFISAKEARTYGEVATALWAATVFVGVLLVTASWFIHGWQGIVLAVLGMLSFLFSGPAMAIMLRIAIEENMLSQRKAKNTERLDLDHQPDIDADELPTSADEWSYAVTFDGDWRDLKQG